MVQTRSAPADRHSLSPRGGYDCLPKPFLWPAQTYDRLCAKVLYNHLRIWCGSSLYIVRTSPASYCRLNLFLSPRKSHTIGGPSTICWPVECHPVCRCPIPPPPHTAYMIDVPVQIQVRLLYYSSGRSDSAKAHRSNGFRSIGTSDRFHNWCLIYFANIRKRFFSIHAKQKYAREATVIKAYARTHLFSNWDLKFCFS